MSSNPGPDSTCTVPPSWSVATHSSGESASTAAVNWPTSPAIACAPAFDRPCKKMPPMRSSVTAASVVGSAPSTEVPTMNICPTLSSRLMPANGSGVGVGLGVGVGVGEFVADDDDGAGAGAHAVRASAASISRAVGRAEIFTPRSSLMSLNDLPP